MLAFAFWFYFHLTTFKGIMISPKGIPIDTISKRRVWSAKVPTIKISPMTVSVPPSSHEFFGTIFTWVIVIVVVLGAKLHATEKRTKKVLLNPRSMILKRRLKLTKIDESRSEKPIVC